jgi:hypothetical protein
MHRFKALAGALLTGLLISGCGSDDTNPVSQAVVDGIVFSFRATPCAGASTRAPTTFPDDALRVSGNAIEYGYSLATYCNALSAGARSTVPAVDGTTIVLTELFEGPAVRCVCSFPMEGRVEPLAPGTYTIRFVYHAILTEGGGNLEPQLLHEATVVVPGGEE